MTGTSWKAILWKEWRENLRWAVFAFLGMVIALFYTVSAANPLGDVGQADKCATLWNAAYLVMTFGCPLIAAALGFAQVMPELRRDQWAFLVHRPVQWSVLFGGKAIVGIALSLAAAGLPFLLFVLWAASPGAVPVPFDARLTLPGIASLLTVVACYFAGMLTALRPARWYGSRALTLPAAIIAVLFTMILPEFWEAAAAALLLGAVLAAAAWGSFLTKGQYTGQPRSAKIGLGVTLYTGTLVTVVTLVSLIVALITTLFPGASGDNHYSYYGIDAKGKILRLTQNDSQQMTAVDLNGKPVALARNGSGGYLLNTLPTAALLWPNNNQSSSDAGVGTYRNTTRLIVSLDTSVDSTGNISWYYVPRERRALGYRQKSRRLVGFLGPAGLSPPTDTDAPRFETQYPSPLPWDDNRVFRFPQSVYYINATLPAVTPIYMALQLGDIQGACLTGGYNGGRFGDDTSIKVVVVASASGFHVYTLQGKLLFTVQREHDPAQYGNVDTAMTTDGKHFFFWYNPSNRKAMAQGIKFPSYVTEVSPSGVVQNRYTLPPLLNTSSTPLSLSISAFGLLAPPFALAAMTSYLEIGHRMGDTTIDGMRESLYTPEAFPIWHWVIVCSVLAGLLSAVLAWLIAHRCVLNNRDCWLWAAGVFWLGLYGVSLLLALRAWPARIPCPNCKRLRVVDRELCEHCGAPFAKPKRDGTEIFEGAGEEAIR